MNSNVLTIAMYYLEFFLVGVLSKIVSINKQTKTTTKTTTIQR